MRLMSWILNVGTPEAVRKIPINTVSLTGEVLGQEFESSLERDLIMLMAWDADIDWFQVQPVKIRYTNPNGNRRSYTPDLLVHFLRNPKPETDRKPILCEVKYREELARNWKELKPKFKAAKAYANEQGWDFQIFTEDRIRTPYFRNIQFLWSYRYSPLYETHHERLLQALSEMEEASINRLLDHCYGSRDRVGRGEGIWTLWCMVARREIVCDLHVPLAMDCKIQRNPKNSIWVPSDQE
ncbi:TnsA endonuclease C terminal [Formivibrio citricus]|uniref:TnsA endonuclease C terminal n=1 Tax=Formivibrio citricus TaxID=83765 RepID=A0A1I4ZD58_9NEIS|nr:TnsA endonuclease N-terminal domain-containing protein [Formivibrio citricus]SFN48128.1 TnsA endonuclease C terminal [Formivibrio citricus]